MNKQRICNFIALEEGLRLKKYRCPAGKLTIGYGHLCTNSTPNVITHEYADKLLSDDVDVVIAQIDQWYYSNCLPGGFDILSPDQQIALTSFVFNLGIKKFVQYHLSTYILSYTRLISLPGTDSSDMLKAVCNRFKIYCHVSGKISEGLKNRRIRESNFFSHEERNN